MGGAIGIFYGSCLRVWYRWLVLLLLMGLTGDDCGGRVGPILYGGSCWTSILMGVVLDQYTYGVVLDQYTYGGRVGPVYLWGSCWTSYYDGRVVDQ
jgi:hypothetical protein